MTPAADGGVRTPVPYRLVLPQGWNHLPVEPVALRAAARAMLQRRFARHPRDRTAGLRHELEEQLVAAVRQPGAEYARKLLTMHLDVERRPVTATCLVSLLPQQVVGEGGLQALADSLAEGAVASVVDDLGPHRAVVVVRDEQDVAPTGEPDARTVALARDYARWLDTGEAAAPESRPDDPQDRPLDEAVLRRARGRRAVDVLLPVPERPQVLLLSFSTPHTALAGPLTELFVTIASTVQWRDDDQQWRA